MQPSSVISRPEASAHPYFPVEAERPGPGVLGQVLRAGILAALLALAVGAPGQGASTPTETETQLTPARQVVELPFAPFMAPAPAAETEPQEQPAAQTGGGRSASRQVGPAGPVAQAPAADGGGDTNVVYDNGTSDSETTSGGSNVNNDANVHAHAGVADTDPEPEGEEPAP